MKRTHRRTVALVSLCAAVLVGCGVNVGESFETIAPQEIPFGLDQPPTTATTTTTTSVPETGPTPPPPTNPVQTEPASVYLIIGLDRLQRLSVQLASPVEIMQVLALLTEGPTGDQAVGLRTAVRPGLVVDVEVDRGVATANLRASTLNLLTPRDQRMAIGQIVLSILGSARGVGQVIFTIDGAAAEIGIPPDFQLSRPGQPLTFSDFESLLVGRPGDPGPSLNLAPPELDDPGDESAITDGDDAGSDNTGNGDTGSDDTGNDDTERGDTGNDDTGNDDAEDNDAGGSDQ